MVIANTTVEVVKKRMMLDILNPRPLSPEVIMPGVGAGKSVREILDGAKANVASALNEFAQGVADKQNQLAADIRDNGRLVMKKMDDDHAETVSAFAEMLGNESASNNAGDTKNESGSSSLSGASVSSGGATSQSNGA